ncbi:MAG: hypothetical protein L6V93_17435 [Clostridiales bacterium]|nr:MAG: hypothetical protein L6V93_17435 [Clostridiales bacterium]
MFSDEEIKKIKSDYKRLKSYKNVPRKNSISVYMAKKMINGKKKPKKS